MPICEKCGAENEEFVKRCAYCNSLLKDINKEPKKVINADSLFSERQTEDDPNKKSFGENVYRASTAKTGPSKENYSGKVKIAAGLLNMFLPGIGRIYMGHVALGLLQLILTFITCGLASIWSFIDGILILVGSNVRDGDGKLMK